MMFVQRQLSSASYRLVLVAFTVLLGVRGVAPCDEVHPASHWAEGVPGHDDGATRDYYNRAARLPWKHRLGDWRDRYDREQGPTPYATATVERHGQPATVSWDVTQIVIEWLQGRYPNQGFFLRTIGPHATVVFASREASDPQLRPKLVLNGEGGTVELEPEADTYLTPSTYRPLGTLTTLRVSGQPEHILIRFRIDDAARRLKPIKHAELRLLSTAQYGTAAIGVFRCRQGEDPLAEPPRLGLAARFPRDRGVTRHRSVWFAEDFESPEWSKRWSYVGPRHTIDVTEADPERTFVPLAGKALRVRIPEGENTGLNMGLRFRDILPEEPEEVYFRYYLRLADDWHQSVSGGKLPGIAGTYGIAGWGGRRSDGRNGWSARGLFLPTIPRGNPLGDTTPVGYYCYHADMEGNYGDNWVWSRAYLGYLRTNRWYCIEQYVKLNTPGRHDGILRGWVDGYLAFEKTDVRFRTVPRLRIEQIWMNVYHGGREPSPYDQHCYIDNIVVAADYIGPMAQANTEP